MVQGKWFVMGSDLSQPMSIRKAVLGRGEDALDAMAQQAVVYDHGQPVGTGRLWWQDGAFRVGDIAVLEDQRGRGFGDLLVRLLLFKALTHNAARIALQCPEALEGFFAQYGFECDERSEGMVAMSIRGEDVHLSHCGGNCAECGHQSAECIPKALREE